MIKKIFVASVIAIAVSISGCSSSIKSVQIIDPDLPNNFQGKKIGASAAYMEIDKNGKMVYTKHVKWLESNLDLWMHDKKQSVKIIQADESMVLGTDRPLLAFYPYINEGNKNPFKFSSEQIRNTLDKYSIDCLLLFSGGTIEEAGTELNYLKFAEFGLRMTSAVIARTSTVGSDSDFTRNGQTTLRGMVFYTCGGEKPLFIGGVQGHRDQSPLQKTIHLLADAAINKTN